MSLAMLQPDAALSQKRPSLAMRVALGLAHTGALMRDADGHWRCRAYPQQRVLDVTVRGLLERGLVAAKRYEIFFGAERECVELVEAGRNAYGTGPHHGRRPPPVAPDVILRELELALASFDSESAELRAAGLRVSEAARDCARRLAEIEATLAKIERQRDALNARRTDLRAIVAHGAERLMETLQEGGR